MSSEPKIVIWDTENSNLSANFGTMLCFGYKYYGQKKTHVVDVRDFKSTFKKDPTNDLEVVKAASEILSDADMWVTWYGCVTPDQRVLTADLRWVPAGELRAGDRLLAFDETPILGHRRAWRESVVETCIPLKKRVYEICVSDGTSVKATGDHPWLVPQFHDGRPNGYVWKKTDELCPGDTFSRLLEPWRELTSRSAGRLAGIFDGEGTVGQYSRGNNGWGKRTFSVQATQNKGGVLDSIQQHLDELGFSFGVSSYDPENRKVQAVAIKGGLREKLRFLGSVRPMRLLQGLDLSKLETIRHDGVRKETTVVSIRDLGVQEIAGLSTSTGTYIAEGFGSHNTKYDVPFLQTRLLAHRKQLSPRNLILPPVPHVDGWRIARYQMKLHSNRLASVTDFLGIHQKTPIKPEVWIRACSGHGPSIQYVVKHCYHDVIALEEAHEIISPLMTNHPNLALMSNSKGACPKCLKFKLQHRGSYTTATTVRKRFQCTACGKWSNAPVSKTGIVGVIR